MSILLKNRSVPSEPTAENTHAPGDVWKEVQLERKWERKVIWEKRVPLAQEIVNNEGGIYRESAWQWVTRSELQARHEQRSQAAAKGGGRRCTPDAVKKQHFLSLVPSSSTKFKPLVCKPFFTLVPVGDAKCLIGQTGQHQPAETNPTDLKAASLGSRPAGGDGEGLQVRQTLLIPLAQPSCVTWTRRSHDVRVVLSPSALWRARYFPRPMEGNWLKSH